MEEEYHHEDYEHEHEHHHQHNHEEVKSTHSRFHSRYNILPIIIIIGIFVLFFHYDLKTLVDNPQLQKNISYVKVNVQKLFGKMHFDTSSTNLKKSSITDFFKFPNIEKTTGLETSGDNLK